MQESGISTSSKNPKKENGGRKKVIRLLSTIKTPSLIGELTL